MAFSNLFKGSTAPNNDPSGGGLGGGPNFMQNATGFFSSIQAKGDDLVTSLKKKAAPFNIPGTAPQQPTQRPHKTSGDGDDDSSASEYGDDGDPAMYADEAPMERKLSAESIDSLPEEEANKYRSDMAQFTTAMLNEAGAGVVTKNAHIFQGYIMHHTGRACFARELRKQTEQLKQVPKVVLDLLTTFCNYALEECNKQDDFAPASIILNVAFRIFEQSVDEQGKVVQTYLYTGLKNHQIWQSSRFWNAAIFISLQEERSSRQVVTAKTGTENNMDAEAELQDNIAYNQLSKCAWRIYSLGLSKEACMDFLRKQVVDTSLSKEKQRSLRANTLRFYSSTD